MSPCFGDLGIKCELRSIRNFATLRIKVVTKEAGPSVLIVMTIIGLVGKTILIGLTNMTLIFGIG